MYGLFRKLSVRNVVDKENKMKLRNRNAVDSESKIRQNQYVYNIP